MDGIFWLGQIFWLMFLVCGVYLSLAFAHLSDEESAKTVSPDNTQPPYSQIHNGSTGFDLSQGSHA